MLVGVHLLRIILRNVPVESLISPVPLRGLFSAAAPGCLPMSYIPTVGVYTYLLRTYIHRYMYLYSIGIPLAAGYLAY